MLIVTAVMVLQKGCVHDGVRIFAKIEYICE